MKTLIKWVSLVPIAAFFAVLLVSGCGSSEPLISVPIGANLWMRDGSLYGVVEAIEEAHQFPDGTVEPGVLVNFGSRIPGMKTWLPTRSAKKMTTR